MKITKDKALWIAGMALVGAIVLFLASQAFCGQDIVFFKTPRSLQYEILSRSNGKIHIILFKRRRLDVYAGGDRYITTSRYERMDIGEVWVKAAELKNLTAIRAKIEKRK